MNKADEIMAALEQDIRLGILGAGTRLKEHELADRFDVSRAPVREALRRLAMAHWVIVEPGRGARVARIHDQQNMDAIHISSVLFGLTCRFAVARMDQSELDALIASIQKMQTYTESDDISAFFDVSRTAWFSVVDATDSPLLKQHFEKSMEGALTVSARRSFLLPEVRRSLIEAWSNLAVAINIRDQSAAEAAGQQIPLISLKAIIKTELLRGRASEV